MMTIWLEAFVASRFGRRGLANAFLHQRPLAGDFFVAAMLMKLLGVPGQHWTAIGSRRRAAAV
jgi:hypothetical protein